MQIKSIAARGEPARHELGLEYGDPEAMERERLYDLIVRFRLRPVRHDAGRAAVRATPQRAARWMTDQTAVGCRTESVAERFERGVIIIDALGRVLFVNRTAECRLEGHGSLERSAAGFLRLPTRELQLQFVEYLLHSRRIDRSGDRHTERCESIVICLPFPERGDQLQITVAPLLDRPLARLVERSSPLHAVFVYESPPGTGWL